MGRSNRQRRAAKKVRARSQPGAGRAGPGCSYSGATVDRTAIEMAAIFGARSASAGEEDGLERAVTMLVGYRRRGGPVSVSATLGTLWTSILAADWEAGWQPSELARQVRRRRRDVHVRLLGAAMADARSWSDAAGASMPAEWRSQLDRLGVAPVPSGGADWLEACWAAESVEPEAGIRLALEALGELVDLPAIEALLPRPKEWRDVALLGRQVRVDDPVLSKVRSLLAKAESTSFAPEAEALSAKAQELMARHAIDDALARAAAPLGDPPATRRVPVDDPYAEAKSTLLHVVARANGVRCVWYGGLAMMAVVGYPADLDAVELLFTSLLVQASKAMLAKGSVTDRSGRSRTRSFRQSFLLAYAGRIRERLEMAALQARRQAEEEMSVDLLPVLATRDREVDEAMASMFPHLSHRAGPTATNEAGWRAGRIAAELAELAPQQAMLEGMVDAG